MQPYDQQADLLFRLVQSQGAGVIHLPYTAEFEELCAALLGRQPSTEEKHEIWERAIAIQRRDADTPEAAAPPPQPEPAPASSAEAAVLPSFSPEVSEPPPSALGFPGSLFGDESVLLQQPWTLPVEKPLPPELQQERDRMLAGVANAELGKMEQRVAYLLARFPETRDSDIALCIRYWRRFQADVLERWDPLDLEVLFELDRLETIGRIRRHIQHALRLYRGMEETAEFRDLFQQQLHEYLAAHKGTLPEVRFYLDETGNEGDKAYVGVGGLCVMNWKQYHKYYAAIAKWRTEQKWPETIHFSETGSDRLDRAIRLLAELSARRSGLLFLGYAMNSRGRTHQDLFSLFIQLVIDSLHVLKRDGCLDAPRSLRVIKEADTGFDNVFLAKMNKQLSDLVGLEFPGQLIVQPIESLPKGREVFLECADLIAGGMQRRALYRGRNPKDKLAEAVFNVTGFDDPSDNGVVFKLHQ
jgi:hypothetical protein